MTAAKSTVLFATKTFTAVAQATLNADTTNVFDPLDFKNLMVVARVGIVPTTLAIALDCRLDGVNYIPAIAGATGNAASNGGFCLVTVGPGGPLSSSAAIVNAGVTSGVGASPFIPSAGNLIRVTFFAGAGNFTGDLTAYGW